MAVLFLAALTGAALVLCAADRMVKARTQARRRREMAGRLAAAATRAAEQEERRTAAAAASKELTAVIPAIQRPPHQLL